MGCNNGKCSRKMKNKEQTMASDPLFDTIQNLKKEINVLRSCFFKVTKTKPIEMVTISEDVKWILEKVSIEEILQIEELTACYRLNIVQRGNQLQNMILPHLQNAKTEQMIGSNTSLGGQTTERQAILDEMTLKILRYCEVSLEKNQENIEDSCQIESQKSQQYEQQRNIAIESVS